MTSGPTNSELPPTAWVVVLLGYIPETCRGLDPLEALGSLPRDDGGDGGGSGSYGNGGGGSGVGSGNGSGDGGGSGVGSGNGSGDGYGSGDGSGLGSSHSYSTTCLVSVTHAGRVWAGGSLMKILESNHDKE